MLSCFGLRRDVDARDSIAHDSSSPAAGSATLSERTDTTERLAALRDQLERRKLDAYVVLSEDAHGSEWVCSADKRREYISGFSGSAGVAIVSRDRADLFVDSRYWEQAAQQIDGNWTLHRVGQPNVQPWDAYLVGSPDLARIGIDARLIGQSVVRSLRARIEAAQTGAELVLSIDENLVDAIWTDRPALDFPPVHQHPLVFAGRPASSKLATLRAEIAKARAGASVLANLPELCWLLNVRGGSIPFVPVFHAYLIVTSAATTLFAGVELFDDETRRYLNELKVELRPYDEIWAALRDLDLSDLPCLLAPSSSWAVVSAIGDDRVRTAPSSVDAAKAIKNDVELQGFRRAYHRDAVAWARWAAWLDEKLRSGAHMTEYQAALKLDAYRRKQPLFAGLAYEDIVASGPNGALPHYAPTRNATRVIDRKTPLVVDCGPQYLDGTIDTTRTVHFGKPTAEQKRAFGRCLQGHIAVDTAKFPEGTTGAALDAYARRALWQDGMDYGHGTGHGIGSYLAVHEGPHAINSSTTVPLAPGHVLSNEPGFYESGEFGIRIESILVVKEVETRRQWGGRRWLGFERLTQVPIDSRLVDFSLLTKAERRWLVDHNKTCRKALLPELEDDKRARRWLKRQ